MNKFAFGTAFAALALALPAAAPAQRNAAAPSILVVDTERVATECTACRAANAALDQQVQQARQLQVTLQQPLQTEGQALSTAVNALNGREPDAALKARIQAYQTREQSANQQLQAREQTIRSTQAHVSQQIGNRLRPILEQIRSTRRAGIVIAKTDTMASDPALDITNEVLVQLNQQLPSVSVTPLPQQPGQAPVQTQPPGR